MMHFTRFIRTFAALDTSINERDNDLYNKNPLGKSGCYMLLPRGIFTDTNRIFFLTEPHQAFRKFF